MSQIRTTIFPLHRGIAVLTDVRTKARYQPPR
jgi:hypothetical protein